MTEPTLSKYNSGRFVKDLPWYDYIDPSDESILAVKRELEAAFSSHWETSYEVAFDDAFCSEIGYSFENDDVPEVVEESIEGAIEQLAYRVEAGLFPLPEGSGYAEEWYKYGTDAGMSYADNLMLDYGEWLAGA